MVSSAEAPAIPDRPKRGLLVLILGACAFFGSSALALFRQNASHNFQSMEELEAAIGVKALGLVPLAKAARISPFWGTRYGCTYREAVRSIYANLFLLRGESSKTTVLTSAFPGEGKTTLALSLAAMARLSGHRTVLIDADFFRAGASTALGLHGKAGLTEVLDQKITLAQALISDASSCIDIITPGQFSRNSGLPSIEKLTALVIEPLQQRGYEFIIIDTPPLFTVSESLILAAHADATVIAVRWGQTARNAVELMTKRLRESGAILAGFVLTMVDKRQHARYGDIYGLAETAYFSRENADYYTQPPALVPPDPRNMVVGALRTAWNRLGIAVIAIATTNFVSLGSCWRASQRNTALRRSKLSSAQPRKALLIVDVQTDFVEAAGLYALPRATTDRLIDQINHIARMIHDTGTIVVYIQQEFDSGRAKLAARLALGRKAGDAASQNRLDPRIESGGRYFLATNFADAFSNPKLENFLRSREVDHVFMVGIEGLLSIQQTAKSALRRGYSVTFIRDAIATASEKAWQRILTKYETEAAFAISSQEFIELSRDSGRALPPMQSAAIGANGF
jgi:capsular exopolysaccharide synthesis family protein